MNNQKWYFPESFEEASISLNIAKKALNKDVWIMKHF